MSTILILFIIIGLALYGLQEYYQIRLGVRPRPTPSTVTSEIIRIMNGVGENGTALDLGSAYGSFIFDAAKRLPGWEFIGVERSPTPWLFSNLRSIGKSYGNYRFYIDDATLFGLDNYDVVFADQNPAIMKKWETGLARRLQPGTLLISLDAPLPRVKPIEKIAVDDKHTLYLYRKAIQQEQPVATPAEAVPIPVTQAPAESFI
jgi:hypothetical protein